MSDIGITVKYGKGYEETWAGFKGEASEVRADLLAYFGLDAEEHAGLTLNELVVNCTTMAHSTTFAVKTLGGTVVAPPSNPAQPPNDEAQADAWSQAESGSTDSPGPVVNPLVAQIEGAADVDALKLLYATHKEIATDAELLARWKAKGKALSTGA